MEFFIHSFGLSFVFGLLLSLWFKRHKKTKSVCIVVLGDIGRSPRMQYHALSFANEGYNLELIGYAGSRPLKLLEEHPNVKIYYLCNVPNLKNRVNKITSYSIKVIWQSVNLLYTLFFKCNSRFLLLQNPPAIPSIPICWFYCYATKVEFGIDWHNYAHTILALTLGENHFLVKLANFVESYFGTKAKHNFCVTKAMQIDLKENWNIQAKVLYDRPPKEFHPISLKEKHELFLRLSKTHNAFEGFSKNATVFTNQKINGEIELLDSRPGLIVSSTSWTEDEDFSILLDSLNDYESLCKSNEDLKLPNLICIITGKGLLKEFYNAIIDKKNWKYVKVITLWLKNEEYPKILASADLGVCLHKSTSGLDLPMKIVDMFGCGLPVCAYNFKCLNELVKHNVNSLVFSNAEELSDQIQSWFINFPKNFEQQQIILQFKNELSIFQQQRWHINWTSTLLPCFKC